MAGGLSGGGSKDRAPQRSRLVRPRAPGAPVAISESEIEPYQWLAAPFPIVRNCQGRYRMLGSSTGLILSRLRSERVEGWSRRLLRSCALERPSRCGLRRSSGPPNPHLGGYIAVSSSCAVAHGEYFSVYQKYYRMVPNLSRTCLQIAAALAGQALQRKHAAVMANPALALQQTCR